MNKMNKAKLMVQVLLMYCWALASGHRILNKYLYNMLGDESRTNLAPYKDKIFFNAGDSALNLKNPDQIDAGTNIKHNNYTTCKNQADIYTDLAASSYAKGDYQKAAYQLSYGFHYVQDMACPVHRIDKLAGYHSLYESYDDCDDYVGCEDFQAVKDAYNDPSIGMGAKLTSLVGDDTGFEILDENTTNGKKVVDYIKNRYTVWKGYHDDCQLNTAKKRVIQDLAFAAAIQKRYLRRPGLKEVFFDK